MIKNGIIDGTVWDDLRDPATGVKLDAVATRYSFNQYNGTIAFANNARYPEEIISVSYQMPHAWREGSGLRFHFHWIQQSSNIPNWLMAYKILPKNTAATIQTDFTGHTFQTTLTHAFTYTSGNLYQITSFPEIDLTGYELSDFIHIVFWRDSANTSTLFAGADPSALTEHVLGWDAHHQIDGNGSQLEYQKY